MLLAALLPTEPAPLSTYPTGSRPGPASATLSHVSGEWIVPGFLSVAFPCPFFSNSITEI